MTKPKPMSAWQESTLPTVLPLHIRRNIIAGDGGCWLWTRSKSRDGYGWASLHDRTHQAHRLVYALIEGPIRPGMVLDHICRVRHCVNPAHLEPVTPRENVARSPLTTAGMGDRCVKGHLLKQQATQRRCVVCRSEYNKTLRAGGEWESRQPWRTE